ncbi:P-type conjugative transfer protein TrbG [Phenylobacterium soli]|uniref:P-type conjugative transfer protein TrbG n=1 Tax=Phenylobacterium soli TaxID=2170551 RepID=A0A328ALQ5_9CAUL|nr:P-type conjugative transfer protein TrbG [Phenylobacterium soli]RAK54936.1 P-type conjugative transfer protein TrbG [Phenylobacterium soli]
MRRLRLSTGLAAALLASGCALARPAPPPKSALAARPTPAPSVPLKLASTPVPNPPEPAASKARPRRGASDPATRRVRSGRPGPPNAEQIYTFAEGALYEVEAAPGRITDIMLQPGEGLSATGPVAAGDTVRWVIGDSLSGAGATARVHVLVKPTRPGLQTNLIVNTDRRTYRIELRATRGPYMPSVAWRYPQDEAAVKAAAVERFATPSIAVEALNFGYRISGDRTPWRPLRVFDDGRQTFIEFPPNVAQSDLPPLFIAGADGRGDELVNYRVVGRRMVLDRLFARAELRLGAGRHQARVRIDRIGA